MNISEENPKFITQNSPYVSRRSLYQLRLQNNQTLRNRVTLTNFPDQEELINQINAKQEQINNLIEDSKKLKTQIEQKERDIKNYEALVQQIENTQNFNMFVKEGKSPNITRSMEINLKRRAEIDKQEIQKLQETINQLKENQKAKNLTKLIKQINDFAQVIRCRNLKINEQQQKINELQQQVENYRVYQKYEKMQQELPMITSQFEGLKNNIEEMIKIKKQTQADLDIFKISYQLIKQLKPNTLQITRYRSSSFKINHKGEIEVIRDFRSKSISQDNIIIEKNWKLIQSLENKNIQLTQQIKQQSDEIKTLKNQILNFSVERQQQENEVQQLNQNVRDNADIIQKLQNDLQVMNHQNTQLKQLMQKQMSDLIEQNRKIDQYKENNEKLNQELQNKDKNKEIEQLRFQINQEIEQKNNNLQIYHQEIEQLKLKLDEQRQENNQLNNNLSNLNLEIQELKQQNEDQNNKNLEYNQTINNLNQEINNIQANLDIKDQNIQELTRIIDKSNQEIQQLTQNKQQLNQDKEQQQNQEKSKLNQEIQQLNQKIQQLNQKIQQQNKVINEKEDKILNLQLDLELYQYSNKTISLLVKSVNSNRSETIQVKLKDSINDVYVMAIQRGIQIQLTPFSSLLIPSKNKRIIQTDWNQKFCDTLIPSDYQDQMAQITKTITIEFGGQK